MSASTILATAKPIGIVCVRDRGRATAFYRDVLGLTLEREDPFAAIFTGRHPVAHLDRAGLHPA